MGSQPTMRRPRVLLADDHRETAEQLRELLRPDFDVVALVEDGRALVSAAAELTPDVIVTDISMPGLDGIEAALQILRGDPQARIVLITIHTESILVVRGLAAGALGYVLKNAAGDELVPAVHAALGGHRYVSRALSHDERTTRPE
jgi:DNA-binding NarL/FixJ family response regulator